MSTSIVLHAHLPLLGAVRDDDNAWLWFVRAYWQCYVPLVEALERLCANERRGVLTLSLSPTLLAMLTYPRERERLVTELERLSSGLRKVDVNDDREAKAKEHHQRLVARALDAARANHSITKRLGQLASLRVVELATTSLSHAILPVLGAAHPDAVAQQVDGGLRVFERVFNFKPTTFWLPECAVDAPTLGQLRSSGIRSTVVAEHAVTASPCTIDGVHCHPRHRRLSLRVWGRDGYPHDPLYREHHEDLGRRSLGLGSAADNESGVKLWRQEKHPEGERLPYEPDRAISLARTQAEDFATVLRGADAPICLAWDAEFLGHWWHEGVAFLEALVTAAATSAVCTVTPQDSSHRVAASSWGEGGYFDSWVSSESRSLWREIRRLTRINATDQRHALHHALAHASDWPFMLHHGWQAAYARQRFSQHCEAARGRATSEENRALDGLFELWAN